jgi:lysophospholipase L1-like esterase
MKADSFFCSLRIAVVCAALLIAAVPSISAADGVDRWVGTWSAPMAVGNASERQWPEILGSGNETIREIVHISIGGTSVRIRLANTYGEKPLTLHSIYVGLQEKGASVEAGSNHAVTFGGSASVTIPAGAVALSDTVPMTVGNDRNLAVSFVLGPVDDALTVHASALTTNYSAVGDLANTAFSHSFTSWIYLSGVDVLATNARGAVVALGDSITDGAASKKDENGRWTDVLARRLSAAPGGAMGVLNEGYGGNNVLTSTPCFGVNAVARVDRDVLAQTDVRDVILLEGINDISQPDFAHTGKLPAELMPCLSQREVTAAEIIAGYKQIIAQVHATGLKIFGATLTPYKGFAGWTEAGEAKREAINRWIATSGDYDGVIDFAKAVADASDPQRFAAEYDSGDHLHPNTAGHEAMGKAIDSNVFR